MLIYLPMAAAPQRQGEMVDIKREILDSTPHKTGIHALALYGDDRQLQFASAGADVSALTQKLVCNGSNHSFSLARSARSAYGLCLGILR